MISGNTRVFALLGRPVAHSLSPRMHNAVFAALGLDAVYVALACDVTALPALVTTLAGLGGGGNVTVPHKAAAARAVVRMTGARIEACNTFWGEEGRAIGANTDVEGVLGGLDAMGASGAAWLILGTGGSASAAAQAAARSGARVAVMSRNTDRAAEFLRRAAVAGASEAEPAECDIVINATPLGLDADDPMPFAPSGRGRVKYALDLVYRAGETPWVHAMRAAGVRSSDGREVLVRQGAASFARWYPGRQAPIEIMRAAVRAGLG
jgi:shikimate dehydrogenase